MMVELVTCKYGPSRDEMSVFSQPLRQHIPANFFLPLLLLLLLLLASHKFQVLNYQTVRRRGSKSDDSYEDRERREPYSCDC